MKAVVSFPTKTATVRLQMFLFFFFSFFAQYSSTHLFEADWAKDFPSSAYSDLTVASSGSLGMGGIPKTQSG